MPAPCGSIVQPGHRDASKRAETNRAQDQVELLRQVAGDFMVRLCASHGLRKVRLNALKAAPSFLVILLHAVPVDFPAIVGTAADRKEGDRECLVGFGKGFMPRRKLGIGDGIERRGIGDMDGDPLCIRPRFAKGEPLLASDA